MPMKRETGARQRVYKPGLAMRLMAFNVWFLHQMEEARHEDLAAKHDGSRARAMLKANPPDRRPVRRHPGKRLPKPLPTARMRWRPLLTATTGTAGASLRQFKHGSLDRLPLTLRKLPPSERIAWFFGK